MYYSVNRTPAKSGTRLIGIDDPDKAIAFFPMLAVAEYVRGFLVFPQGRAGTFALLAQPVELPVGQLTGEPMEIGQTRVSETMGRTASATTPSGVIAMLGPVEGMGQFTWISRDGRALEAVGAPASQLGVELSSDGEQLATFRSGDIWTMNLARPVPNRLTQNGVHGHPIWSPDNGQILTLFQRGVGSFDLGRTSVATAKMETVREAPNGVKPAGWTREGRLVWIESGTGGRLDSAV
jgi:hypothetical protein